MPACAEAGDAIGDFMQDSLQEIDVLEAWFRFVAVPFSHCLKSVLVWMLYCTRVVFATFELRRLPRPRAPEADLGWRSVAERARALRLPD